MAEVGDKPAVDMSSRAYVDLRSLGGTGLQHSAGYIHEERMPRLQGSRGKAIYKEMAEDDPIIGSALRIIDTMLRTVPWEVQAASTQEFDMDAAAFVDSCLDDMDTPLIDTMSEIFSMLTYGFSLHEIVYKRRCGDAPVESMRSKHADGMIGWRRLPCRSQDTIQRWIIADDGTILGAEQCAPPNYIPTFLPIKKCLLFRTSVQKNNPEGKSILRCAVRDWYYKKNVEAIEQIGIERDVAGLPVAKVPAELIRDANNGDADAIAMVDLFTKMVTNVRRDEQEGIVLPMAYDENGKELYSFSLLSSAGSRQININEVIQRHDNRMALALQAEFILMGQAGQSGAYAMHVDKTDMFMASICTYLDIVENTINQHAVPELCELNGLQISDYPKIKHGPLERTDVAKMAAAIQQLTMSGMRVFDSEGVTDAYVRKQMGLPEVMATSTEDEVIAPRAAADPDETIEITDPNERPATASEHAQTLGLPQQMVEHLRSTEQSTNRGGFPRR